MALKEKVYDYVAKRHERRRSMEIPEFGETIYFVPVDVLEMEKIITLSGGGTSSKDFHIWTIIEKAEDEKGNKIFSIEDKPILEKMDWSIISRISNEIQRIERYEETKKNSPITPS